MSAYVQLNTVAWLFGAFGHTQPHVITGHVDVVAGLADTRHNDVGLV
jgi:hypothetical protein